MYQSTGIIMVAPKEDKILKTEAVSQEAVSSLDYLNTVVRAISSRALLVAVVQDNKLGKSTLLNPSGELSEARIASLIASKMEVHLRKGTRLIEVTVTDQDPSLARQLATAVISGFIKDVYRQRSSVARSAADFLNEEAAKLRKKLLDSEQRLQRYKEEHDSVSLQQNQNIIVDKLHQLNFSVTAAEDKRLKIESDLEQFRLTDPDNTADLLKIPSVAALPQVASISQQITQAATELGALQERYLSLHPKYITYQNRIRSLEDAQARIVKTAGEDLAKQVESARQNELKIRQLLKEQEEKSLQLDKLGIEYNALKRDVDTDSALYSTVVARMKEVGVSAENENIPYRIAEDPLPGVSVPSSGPLVIGGTLLFLALISAFAIVVQDMFGTGIKSVDQAEKLLGLPTLGCIPEIKNMRDWSLVVINQPSSVEAEAFRTLRAGVILHDSDKSLRGTTILTSAVPEEGKSTIALNMAASFAMVGESTLLIDADLRRPSIHKALGIASKGKGLSDILEGRCPLEGAIQQTGVENLSVITAGATTKRPAEIFSTPDLGQLIASLKGLFAHIVIDTAPINAVADTLILSHHADRVLLVMQSERTPVKAIRRAVHLLKKSSPVIAGTIINRLQRSGAGYYYYYYGGKYSKDSVYGEGDGRLS